MKNEKINITDNNLKTEEKIRDDKNNDEKQKNNDTNLLMFERLLNNKNKFKLDNNFDTINSQKFLNEKEKYLSEIVIDDGGELSYKETFEKTKSKKEILIPYGAPTKYTFGQN